MNPEVTPEGTPVDPSATSAPVDPSSALAPAKKSKLRRNVLIAGSAVGLVGIGSTLAANISLNGGNNVEFGQGVARTTSCDADGFTINPVTSYDNERSIWRLDRVDITGLNLTPVGTGFQEAGYSTQADAKAAHPGEYYDNGTWKRTCDGVVLDFKAYTDDVNFWPSTREGYSNGTSNDIATPLAWAQWNGRQNNDRANFGFAVIFNTNDDNNGEVSNWGVGTDTAGASGYTNVTTWDNLDHSTAANSSFSFGSYGSNDIWRPNSASISKIAVSSMATFPSDYNLDDNGGIGRG
jgi:hypothetical protein